MDPEESSVDKLQRRLYQYGEPPKERERRVLHEEAHKVATSWTDQEDVQQEHAAEQGTLESYTQMAEQMNPSAQVPAFLRKNTQKKEVIEARRKERVVSRFVRAVFFTALSFFALSLAVAGYFFFFERNQISCDNVDIDVTGPLTIPSGKELVLNVGISNKNPTPIDLAELVVKYPEGTRSPENTGISLSTVREKIGSIKAGERVRSSTHALLYGREQTEYTINLSVEYRVEDSNAVFECEAPYKVIIATAPVSLAIDGVEEVSSGQELELKITLSSNSDEIVRDQRVVADYPFGFEFVRAEPMPSNQLNAWDIGDIAPGSLRTITVYGIVSAPTVESRSIKFKVGEKDPNASDRLLTTLQLIEHPFLIAKPFLSLDLAVNGSNDTEVPVTMGEPVQALLSWTNTLPYAIYDVEVEVDLNSPYIDPRTVGQGRGYYRSVDRTLIWTGQTEARFKSIKPDETGVLDFSFNTIPLAQDTSAREPNLVLGFTVRARRVSDDSEVSQKLVAQSTRTVKFNSQLDFKNEVLFAVGPFVNTGMHPPVPNYPTTYTIHWALANNTSDIENVKVTAELPINITWLNTISPQDGSIGYNPTTHVVTWNPGTVEAGTGSTRAVREVYFQISVLPSITDRIEQMYFTKDLVLTGVDRYTRSVLELIPREIQVGQVARE